MRRRAPAISDPRMRGRWPIARSFALLALLGACATVPISGRSQLLLLTEWDEVKLGRESYQDILAKERVSANPVLNNAVQRVGRRLAASTARDYEWEFKIVDNDKVVNAFCLPGGKVVIYTGMFRFTRDEDSLAAVLGHEVAHAIARHGGERLSQRLLAETALEAVEVGMRTKDPNTTKAVKALLGAGLTVGVLLPYSREHESEADYLGLVYMARAGYDPRASRDFWQRMSAQFPQRKPEFLSTHPADLTRVRQIEQWLPEALRYYRASSASAPPSSLPRSKP